MQPAEFILDEARAALSGTTFATKPGQATLWAGAFTKSSVQSTFLFATAQDAAAWSGLWPTGYAKTANFPIDRELLSTALPLCERMSRAAK